MADKDIKTYAELLAAIKDGTVVDKLPEEIDFGGGVKGTFVDVQFANGSHKDQSALTHDSEATGHTVEKHKGSWLRIVYSVEREDGNPAGGIGIEVRPDNSSYVGAWLNNKGVVGPQLDKNAVRDGEKKFGVTGFVGLLEYQAQNHPTLKKAIQKAVQSSFLDQSKDIMLAQIMSNSGNVLRFDPIAVAVTPPLPFMVSEAKRSAAMIG